MPLRAVSAALKTPRVALTSPTTATSVHRIYGPVHYGKTFGLEMSASDFTIFDDHATATQAVLSGQDDVIGGSFVSTLLVRQAGQDFKTFCPNVGNVDYVLVGRNGIKSVAQLLDPKTRVGVNTPGSGGDAVLNAILQVNNITTPGDKLPNTIELGSSALRLSAWAAGKVDVTVLQLNQYRQAEKEVPDAVIIAALYEAVPYYIHTVFSAPAQWLDHNIETAAALCASTLKAGRELSANFDLFNDAVQELLSKPPKKESLRELFSMLTRYDFWQLEKGIQPQSVNFMANVAYQSGQLESLPKYEDVVDERPYKLALELLANDIHSIP